MSYKLSEEDFIKQAQPLFRSIYKRNAAGCCLHCMIDDGNWDAEYGEEDLEHKDCRKLYDLIWQLDYEERERIEYDYQTRTLTFAEPEEEDCPHCGRPYC